MARRLGLIGPVLAALAMTSGIAVAQGTAAKPAARIYADALTEFAKARTVVLVNTIATATSSATLRVEVDARGSVRLLDPDGKAEIRIVGSQTFTRADSTYWVGQGVDQDTADQLHDRWVVARNSAQERAVYRAWRPAALARCLDGVLGTLSKGRVGRTGGRPTIELRGKGGGAGSAAGRAHVTTTGRPLLVRLVIPRTSAKSAAAGDCQLRASIGGGSDQPLLRGELSFAYDRPLRIAAPAGAVRIDGAAAGSGQTTP